MVVSEVRIPLDVCSMAMALMVVVPFKVFFVPEITLGSEEVMAELAPLVVYQMVSPELLGEFNWITAESVKLVAVGNAPTGTTGTSCGAPIWRSNRIFADWVVSTPSFNFTVVWPMGRPVTGMENTPPLVVTVSVVPLKEAMTRRPVWAGRTFPVTVTNVVPLGTLVSSARGDSTDNR